MRSRLVGLLRERMRMLKEDALAVAQVVDEAFKGHSELDDDLLDPHTRQVFYDLQDEKILDVRRQEYTQDGRLLRGYFWSVEETVLERPAPLAPPVEEFEGLYETLEASAWARRPRQV